MKRILIVGNWKMHLNTSQASLLVHRLHERIRIYRDIEVVLAPSMLVLQPLSMQIDRRKFRLCAQNAYQQDEGPYTGEVSFAMLQDLVHYCIVGHSSRRKLFRESLKDVQEKVAAAVRNDIAPIICIGETKHERNMGEAHQVLHDQLTTALANVTSSDLENVVLVYEPVWAISANGGELPKPDVVEKSIAFMRNQVTELYGKRAAEKIRILYGGSVNNQVARGYLDVPGVDGFLVGAASLNYQQFSGIVDAAYRKLRDSGETDD